MIGIEMEIMGKRWKLKNRKKQSKEKERKEVKLTLSPGWFNCDVFV